MIGSLSRQEMAQPSLQLIEFALERLLTLFGGEDLPPDATPIMQMNQDLARRHMTFEDREWAMQLSDIRRRVNALRGGR